MGTTLQFIDQGAIGSSRSDRRIIRSHVMKGKNAGKPRKPRRKQASIVHVNWLLTCPNTSTLQHGSKPGRQLLWNDLSLTSFPRQLDSESTKLMHRWFFDISDALFPPQFCSKFDMVKSLWVNYVLADEAYFHCTLAISSSYVHFFERKPGIASRTLHHISQACALVNLKLSGPESVSDSAIAAVVTLVVYQQIHRLHSTGLIHLSGLYQMIQLRGGIHQLMKENRPLALKALRLDVELALQTGLPTLFCSDTVVTMSGIPDEIRVVEDKPVDTTVWLPCILVSLISFARILNNSAKEGQTKLDPLSYMEMLVSLLYRLIKFAPLDQADPASGTIYDNFAHLAMLAFMTTLLPEYGRDDSGHPLLSDHLEDALRDCYLTFTSLHDRALSLLLWALFIGGISVSRGKDHRSLILEICKRLGLQNWLAVRGRLREFPWIHALHDAPGQCLWEDTMLKRTDTTPNSLQLEA